MSTEPLSEAAGWYGKLAPLGDFAQRRLSAEFVQRTDAWLSRAMSASREQLGERWLDLYLTAPVMRFAWAPGVVDTQWWFGLLMPSCDKAGRYFPLLIAQRRPLPPLDRIALDHLEAWFDHLALAATRTLGEGASVEAFEQALLDAPPWPTPGVTAPVTTRVTAHGQHYRLGPWVTPHRWLHALGVAELHARFAGCTLWWRPGGAGQGASASVTRGLPEPAAFADMLSEA